MINDATSGPAQKLLDDQQFTTRCLIDAPASGWRLFGLAKALHAHRGDLCLPEFANQTLRVAFAHLATTHAQPAIKMRLECSEWAFDAVGRVDQVKLWPDIVNRIDPVDGPINFSLMTSVDLSAQDLDDITRCLTDRRA